MPESVKFLIGVSVVLALMLQTSHACSGLVTCTNTYTSASAGQTESSILCPAIKIYLDCLLNLNCGNLVQPQVDTIVNSTRSTMAEMNCNGAGTALMSVFGPLLTVATALFIRL